MRRKNIFLITLLSAAFYNCGGCCGKQLQLGEEEVITDEVLHAPVEQGTLTVHISGLAGHVKTVTVPRGEIVEYLIDQTQAEDQHNRIPVFLYRAKKLFGKTKLSAFGENEFHVNIVWILPEDIRGAFVRFAQDMSAITGVTGRFWEYGEMSPFAAEFRPGVVAKNFREMFMMEFETTSRYKATIIQNKYFKFADIINEFGPEIIKLAQILSDAPTEYAKVEMPDGFSVEESHQSLSQGHITILKNTRDDSVVFEIEITSYTGYPHQSANDFIKNSLFPRIAHAWV